MLLFIIGLMMLLSSLFPFGYIFFSRGFTVTDWITVVLTWGVSLFMIIKGLKNRKARKAQAAHGKPPEPFRLSPKAKRWIYWIVTGYAAIMLIACLGGIFAEIIRQEPDLPVDLPEEFFTMKDSCVVYDEEEGSSLTVAFESDVESIDGLWYGKDAIVTINGHTYKGEPTVDRQPWGNFRYFADTKVIDPSFTTILDLQDEDIHQVLTVDAEMECYYITSEDETSYAAFSTTLYDTYDIFVITEEEMAIKNALDRYEKRGLTIALIIAFMVGIIGVYAFMWFLLRRRKKIT